MVSNLVRDERVNNSTIKDICRISKYKKVNKRRRAFCKMSRFTYNLCKTVLII